MQTNLYSCLSIVSFGPFSWPPYALRQTKQKQLKQNAFRVFVSLRRRRAACSSSTLRLCSFPFVLYFHFGVHTRLLARGFSLLLFTDAERFRSVTRCWQLSTRFSPTSSVIKRLFAMHFDSEFCFQAKKISIVQFGECWPRCAHHSFIASNNNINDIKN